jgi:hypothetical protein
MIASWWAVVLIPAIVLALLAVLVLPVENRRIRRVRAQHLASHPPRTDDEYCRESGVAPEDASFALDVRSGFARLMGIPSNTVYPSDTLEYAVSFGWDNSCFLEVEMVLGLELGARFPKKFWDPLFASTDKPLLLSIREMTAYIIDNRSKLVPRKKTSRRREQ